MSTPHDPLLKPGYSLREGPEGLTITVPFPRKPTVVMFLLRNAPAFVVVLLMAMLSPFVPLAWLGLLIGLLFLGGAVLLTWISMRYKREILRFTPDMLRMELRGLVSRSIIQFPLEGIANLRVMTGGGVWYVTPGFAERFVPRFLGRWANWLLGPTLAFDHGPVLIRFAFGLQEWQAQRLLREIAGRFPQIVE